MRPAVYSVCLILITFIQPAAAQLPNSALAVFGRMPFHNGSRIHMSAMSPHGKYLATLSSRSATVWDSSTGQPVHRFFFGIPTRPGYRRGIAFSPDSKRFVCGPDSENIYVWDLATGNELRRFATEFEMFGYSFLRFSADGAAIIVESNDEVTWRNIKTGKTVHRLPYGRLKQLSPDEKTFVLVRESKKHVVIGDVATGKIKHTLPIAAHFREDREILFLPDGVTLAVVHRILDEKRVTYSEVQFWNVETGKRQERTWALRKSDGWVSHDLALSLDGKVLYSSALRYDLDESKELPVVSFLQNTYAIFPHPDGKTLFSVGSEEIRRCDLSTGKEITKDADFLHWRETAVSPDGRWLALRGAIGHDGSLESFDTKTHAVKRVPWPWNNGETIAFTADSGSLAVNQYSHLEFLKAPELSGFKKLAAPKGHSFNNAAIGVSKDGRYLSTRESVGRLRVFDLHIGQEIWSHEEIWKAALTPDSKRIVVDARDRSAVWLYDLAAKKAVFEIKRPIDRGGFRRGRGASIADWAFSPNGRILAVAMTGGHVVMLDAATGKERARFLAMDTNALLRRNDDYYLHVTKLAFSPDGQWLAGGGDDGFLRIWDVATRRELHRLHGHEGETQTIGFTADGRRLLSFGVGEGFVWDLRPKLGKPITNVFADLLADDGPTVYRALWSLADDPQAPDLLRQKLPAQRLDIGPERIKQLITDLGSSSFPVREAAARHLTTLEENVRPACMAALAHSPSLEVTRRIQQLLETLDNDATPSRLRAVRAVCAMELQDSDEARKLLREWADGTPGLHLTQESRASVQRLQTKR